MVTIDVGLLVLRPQITSTKESKKQFDCNEKKKNSNCVYNISQKVSEQVCNSFLYKLS